MRDKKEFYQTLQSLDGRKYAEYQNLVGDFDFARFVLKINRIAEEGTATLFVIRVPQIIASFPPHLFNTPVRRTALEDLLARTISDALEDLARYDAAGISRRRIGVASPGQKILPRSSLVVTEEYVEARVYIDLPAKDGRIDGDSAHDIFFEDLPSVVNQSLIYCNLVEPEVDHFVDVMEDADQLRQLLSTQGMVSFISDHSLLERTPGTDMPEEGAPTLKADDGISIEMNVPNAGSLKGLGIPNGLTVILGDAYSGRIALMDAIAQGVYNHIPGDGREYTVSLPDAVYVSADPGRSVQRVDISPFVHATSTKTDTAKFTVSEADPCASQAAALMESLEIGARVLLFDESQSSPAFLSRDSRLNGLLPEAEQRVIPLSAQARQLVDELGISIVVAGNSSVAEFLPVADTVLRIDGGTVVDITAEAKQIEITSLHEPGALRDVKDVATQQRWIVPTSIDPSSGKDDFFVEALDENHLLFGRTVVELDAITQLADIHQAETIGRILCYAKTRYLDEGRPLREVLDLIDRDLSSEGLECLTRELNGSLARARRFEIAAVLNRLNTLRVSHIGN